MKRVLLIMLAICTLASCSKDNGDETPKNIEITGGNTTQEVFADNTQGKEGVKFTTTGAWTSSIVPTTKAETADWVSIDPASGDKAGDYTINIIFTPNYTGENRKAEIKISCGGTVITITVEQKGLTEDNKKPEILPEQPKFDRVVSRIDRIDSDPNRPDSYAEFKYDDKKRVSTFTRVNYLNYPDEINPSNFIKNTSDFFKEETTIKATYDGSTISFKEETKLDDGTTKLIESSMAQLNPQGRVEYVKTTRLAHESLPESTDEFYMSYDANGFWLKTIREEQDNNQKSTWESIWTSGNLRTVDRGDNVTEKAAYGTLLNNKTNLDLNWILYSEPAEGFGIIFGTYSQFYSMQGYGGIRSKNMVEKMETTYSSMYTYSYEFTYELNSEGYPEKINYRAHTRENDCTYVITYTKL